MKKLKSRRTPRKSAKKPQSRKKKSAFKRLALWITTLLSVVTSLALMLSYGEAFAQVPGKVVAPDTSNAAEPPIVEPPVSRKPRFKRSKLTRDESEALADKRKLLLSTGEDKAVDLNFEANAGANGIAIGNPQIVTTTSVKIGDKRQIVFKPLKAGETTVTVRDADGTLRLIFYVRVTGSNLLRQAAEIRELLRDIEGIEIRVVGQRVVVDGEVLVPTDYGRLISVLGDKTYADTVLNLANLSPLAMQVLSKRIQEDVNAFAPNVKTRVVNGLIFLEGTVDNVDQANRAKEVAKIYLPDVRPGNPLAASPNAQILPPRSLIQNFLVVNPPPPKKAEKLVRVTVHFVELTKDYNKVFGFKWQPGFTSDPQISVGTTGAGGTGTSGTSFTGTISSLFPKLASAQAAGYARVLKTGTIIVRSGQAARIDEQTQYPTLSQGANGQVTSGAPVGVGIKIAVTPLIVGQSEDIQLDLDLQQTNLVGRQPASSTAPTIANHNVMTKLYVKSNESAAVAGVTAGYAYTDFNKDDPASGTFSNSGTGPQTQPLFSLLHSKNYSKQKTQFVIFVTPQIVENASEGTEDLKKNFRVKVK